ncbi:MAG: septum formation initiator family protein [Brumimicrobium sp.]
MKRLKVLKNKYILTSIIFVVYILFIDDVDIFNILRQEAKLRELKQNKIELAEKYNETKQLLEQLDDDKALERYARENKFFKQDDEDIFVIVYDK